MGMTIQTSTCLAKTVDEQTMNELWSTLCSILQDSYAAESTVNITNEDELNSFADSLDDRLKDCVSHTVVNTFCHDKTFIRDYLDGSFHLSVNGISYLLDTLTVLKDGQNSSYKNAYGIPEITEENIYAVIAHLALNMTCGDLAKGYTEIGVKKVSLSQYATGYSSPIPRVVQPYTRGTSFYGFSTTLKPLLEL